MNELNTEWYIVKSMGHYYRLQRGELICAPILRNAGLDPAEATDIDWGHIDRDDSKVNHAIQEMLTDIVKRGETI